jgi:hypothetical protein
VVLRKDGDVTLGFQGFAWHTHADILGSTSHPGPGDVVEGWIADLLAGHLVVAVSRVGGTVRDVWVTDDLAQDLRWRDDDEEIEFRLWDGRRARL